MRQTGFHIAPGTENQEKHFCRKLLKSFWTQSGFCSSIDSFKYYNENKLLSKIKFW